MIPFNIPYLTGKEATFIQEVLASGKTSGDGEFSRKCQRFFEQRYGFTKCLLTTSCTDALELASILLNIQPGDEVIIPSYTFVSTANPFVLRGAKIVFADSGNGNPNVDANEIRSLVTAKTKAIVPVHYAGIACEMDEIKKIASENNLAIVEDAAHALDSSYKNKPLGSLGNIGAFSFHETKNIVAGEGGMIAINDPTLISKAEIIREKGTNRSAFLRGEVEKYNWIAAGSSFLPSELIAAFLFAQLQELEAIQRRRKSLWSRYFGNLSQLEKENIQLPFLPKHTEQNGSIFFITCRNRNERDNLILFLKQKNISASFHYQALHQSPYFSAFYSGKKLVNAERYAECLVRLPLYTALTEKEVDYISDQVVQFYRR